MSQPTPNRKRSTEITISDDDSDTMNFSKKLKLSQPENAPKSPETSFIFQPSQKAVSPENPPKSPEESFIFQTSQKPVSPEYPDPKSPEKSFVFHSQKPVTPEKPKVVISDSRATPRNSLAGWSDSPINVSSDGASDSRSKSPDLSLFNQLNETQFDFKIKTISDTLRDLQNDALKYGDVAKMSKTSVVKFHKFWLKIRCPALIGMPTKNLTQMELLDLHTIIYGVDHSPRKRKSLYRSLIQKESEEKSEAESGPPEIPPEPMSEDDSFIFTTGKSDPTPEVHIIPSD